MDPTLFPAAFSRLLSFLFLSTYLFFSIIGVWLTMKIVYTYVVHLKRNHADILSYGCPIKIHGQYSHSAYQKNLTFFIFSWFALCYNLGKHTWSPPDSSPWRLCSKKGNIGVLNSKARGQKWEHRGPWAQTLVVPICGAKSLIGYLAAYVTEVTLLQVSLFLCFLNCMMRIIIVPTSRRFWELH